MIKKHQNKVQKREVERNIIKNEILYRIIDEYLFLTFHFGNINQ